MQVEDYKQNAAQKIMFIEYLRVFAFVSVFLSHKFGGGARIEYNSDIYLIQIFTSIYNSTMSILWNGQAGVVIFFIISGYIIAAKASSESLTTFAIKRVFRIYPLFIVCVLAEHFLNRHFPPPEGLSVASPLWQRLTLFGDFWGASLSVGGVEWTLRIEMLFYIFSAAVSLLKIPKNSALLTVALVISTVGSIVGPKFPNFSTDTVGKFNEFFPFLMIGTAIYYCEIKRLPIAVAIFIAIISLGAKQYNSMHLAMVSIFVIMWSLGGKIKHNAIFASVATITYSFYLIHDWMYDFCARSLSHAAIPNIVISTLSTTIVIILSIVAFNFIEKPCIRIGNKICKWKDKIIPSKINAHIDDRHYKIN